MQTLEIDTKTKKKVGRPPSKDTLVPLTTVITDEQLSFLDEVAYLSKKVTGYRLTRTVIIRAMLGAVLKSGIQPSDISWYSCEDEFRMAIMLFLKKAFGMEEE